MRKLVNEMGATTQRHNSNIYILDLQNHTPSSLQHFFHLSLINKAGHF